MAATTGEKRQSFAGRNGFIFAAIGSAVGLGNIWRFPYQAYSNGGGAFLIPYLVALLTAGIPYLIYEFAVGHRFRGSAPVSYRRLHRSAEPIGWWQVGISFIIGVYYAAIVAWAIMFTYFSFNKSWGEDPEAFLFGEYLHTAETVAPTMNFVPGVLIPMIVVWLLVLGVLAAGVQKGLAVVAQVFIPVLAVAFAVLVVIALTLPGAAEGLNAFFTPNFAALADPNVWIAAYTQIFFSLSIGFGIMITYASYLKRRTNLTSSALTVGFANSSFEILGGIGVFATLGFMAVSSGVAVDEVATQGVGLAFVVFPTILNQAPLGALLGVLFFGSLVLAGFTSLISIVEVVISAVADKTGLSRVPATLIVGGLMAIISLLLFSTTTGLPVLDTSDAFVNAIGIAGAAVVALIVVCWFLRRLQPMVDHVNSVSSFKVGGTFKVLIGVITPIVLAVLVVLKIIEFAVNGYEGYPGWFLGVFGWGMSIGLIVVALLLSLIPWHNRSALLTQHTHEDLTVPGAGSPAAPQRAEAGSAESTRGKDL